jgi:hypothetical protein
MTPLGEVTSGWMLAEADPEGAGWILTRAEQPSGARLVRVIDLDTHKLRTFWFGCVGKHSGGVLGTATMPCFTVMAGPVRELQRAQTRTV